MEYDNVKSKIKTGKDAFDKSGRDIKKLEKKVIAQRQAAKAKVESAKLTEAKHRLQTTVNTLNKLLLNPTRDSHVPDSLEASVVMAMKAINGSMYSANANASAKRLSGYYQQLADLQNRLNSPNISTAKAAEIMDKIEAVETKITNVKDYSSRIQDAIGKLRDPFKKLQETEEGIYDSEIDAVYESIGGTAFENLTAEQVENINDAYRAVLSRIRKANKLFKENAAATVESTVKTLYAELRAKPQQSNLQNKTLEAILSNPFKRFEDMQMLRHTKTIGIVQVDEAVWKKLSVADKEAVARVCNEKLHTYFSC